MTGCHPGTAKDRSMSLQFPASQSQLNFGEFFLIFSGNKRAKPPIFSRHSERLGLFIPQLPLATRVVGAVMRSLAAGVMMSLVGSRSDDVTRWVQ